MTTPQRKPYPHTLPGVEAFAFAHDLMSFLERNHLTLEDAELTIRHGCDLSTDGLSAQQVANFFVESHNIPDKDVHHVRDLAALMLYRGRIMRSAGGRYVATIKPEPAYGMALVKIPLTDWEAFQHGYGQYIHRGRTAWVIGPGDRA